MMSLFSVNCNRFGPGSKEKIDQLVREINSGDANGVVISSSDKQ